MWSRIRRKPPTIYCTWSDHDNHYTTDVVENTEKTTDLPQATNKKIFHGKRKSLFKYQWEDDDDEVCFVIDQHAELDFYSASLLKQQSADRHVAPLKHIILIPSQPVFALSP